MKKVATVGLLLIFALAGCAGQSSDEQNESNSVSGGDVDAGFVRPEEKPDISGLVKTIVGNEITILKITRPGDSENEDNENVNTEKDESEKEQKTGSGGGMGMGSGMGSRTNTDMEDDDRLAMLKSMSTGEEKIIIPVGIKMLKKDNEKEDEKMVEATLDDVTKDKMLMIWIDKDITDKNIANFVIIN